MRAPAIALVALLGLAGCFPYHHSRPGAEGWAKDARKVGVLSSIRVLEVLPGGVKELHEEWTDQAAKNVVAALKDALAARGFTPRVMSWKGDEELDEVRLLYAEVGDAIWRYTYPPYPFPHKTERFEYGLGPIGRILDRAAADVLVVAAGGDHVGSDGQKYSMFAGTDAWALLSLGLVDREGNVLWFDIRGGAGIDLRKEADVRASVEEMLNEMPGVVR